MNTNNPGPVQNCVTNSYSHVRRHPELKNASIDRIDSCSEVTAGLAATIFVTVTIWVIAMPFFDIGGMMWIKSWEDTAPADLITLSDFKTRMTNLGTVFGPGYLATVDDFANATASVFVPPMDRNQSEFAYARFDLDGDQTVTETEFNYVLTFDSWAAVHGSTTSTTTTATTTTLPMTTTPYVPPAAAPTPAPVVHTTQATLMSCHIASEAHWSPAQRDYCCLNHGIGCSTSTTRHGANDVPGGHMPSSYTGPFVTVNLHVPHLGGEQLQERARQEMARVVRQDLAYAAGIPATDVMAVTGRTGCVFMPAGTGPHDVTFRERGCLMLPAGATSDDFRAVLVSHSMKDKIADDLTRVHMLEDRPIASSEIHLEVSDTDSCEDHSAGAGVVYCEDGSQQIGGTTQPHQAPAPPPPTTTTTTVATTSTTANEEDIRPVSFREFLDRMGAATRDSPRDAFAAVDTSGDEVVSLEEFQSAATNQLAPPISAAQAEDLFHAIDTNGNSQVEPMEFFDKYQATDMNSQHLAAPISLEEYKSALGRAVHFLNTTLRINSNINAVSAESSWRVIDSIVDDIAFEAGVPTMSCHDLNMGSASVTLYVHGNPISGRDATAPAPAPLPPNEVSPLVADFMIEIPEDRSDADVVAVLNTQATKQRIASHLSTLPNLGQVNAGDIVMHFDQVAGEFNFLDQDHNGRLDLQEFTRATRKFSPALTEQQAQYAWHGLDGDAEPGLNHDEFNAVGVTEFRA